MHAAVPYSSQQAGGAQSRAIPYRSRQFGIGSSHGYAAFEWLGSTWCLRGWSQQPPGITPIPATQPLSKRPLIVLPTMLVAAWASELNGVVKRVKRQSSSDRFWARYVPADRPTDTASTKSDVMVLGAGALLVGVFLVSFRF